MYSHLRNPQYYFDRIKTKINSNWFQIIYYRYKYIFSCNILCFYYEFY